MSRVPAALPVVAARQRSDVLSVTTAAIRDGVIRATASKRGVQVMVPMHPDLLAILAEAPRHDAVTNVAHRTGQPWGGLNSPFGKAIGPSRAAKLVVEGPTMQGLRHTLETRLLDAGADLDDIRRILGQETLVMAQHYSETADTSEKARAVVARLDMTRTRRDG